MVFAFCFLPFVIAIDIYLEPILHESCGFNWIVVDTDKTDLLKQKHGFYIICVFAFCLLPFAFCLLFFAFCLLPFVIAIDIDS
jgi:hypothetical protein